MTGLYVGRQKVHVGERWWFRTSEPIDGGLIEVEYQGTITELEDYPPAQLSIHLDDGTTVWRGNIIEMRRTG